MKITIPSHLSDDTLIAEVKSLAGRGRENTAQLVAHLAELDERRLYLRAGFPSLFMYCREVLRLSESEAYNRIEAARAVRRFPIILDKLVEGTLNLTTVRLLAPHLTEMNHQELLASAAGKSRREVDELLASRLVAAVPSAPAEPDLPAQPLTSPPPSRPVVSPLAPDRYQIRFTASASMCEMLRQAQDLLRHAIPSGDAAQIIERALRLLLQDLARKKFAGTDRPRQSRGTARGSRDLPAKLQREVWRRGHGGQDRAALPGPQQLRGRVVLRAPVARAPYSFRNEFRSARAAVRPKKP